MAGPGHRGRLALPATGCGGSCTSRPRSRASNRPTAPLARKAHETIAKVTDDIDRRFVFNTPIAAVMELVNEIGRAPGRPRRALRRRDGGVADPAVRAARRRGAVERARRRAAVASTRGRSPIRRCSSARRVEVVVQVNGKVRDRLQVPRAPGGGSRRAGAGLASVCGRTWTAASRGRRSSCREARQPRRLTGRRSATVAASLTPACCRGLGWPRR